MSLKYLNLSGLEDLWINIKNYILSKIPTKTSELTNDSGYLTSHQSLDNYVTLDTYQTITAIKVITGGNQGKMLFKNPNYTKGDAIESGTIISRLYFGNGTSYGAANGILTFDINSSGNTSLELAALNNTASSSNRASLIITYDKSATRPRLLKSWGDFIPNSNDGYSLGNTSNIWKECYSNAYYLGTTAFGDIVTHNASEFLTSHQSLSNYVTLDGTQTIAGTKTFSSTISGNISGNAGTATTATKVVGTVANNNTGALVQGTMGTNDCFRIAIGGASNAGWAEIATGDDYNEPIYVRQYQGSFTTLKRTATLLDGSGNTSFPGTVTATGFSGPLTGNVTGNCSGSSGSCTGNAATATQFSANTTVALTGDATGTSAGSKKGWSIPVTLANSGVTAGTYGPSADVTGSNNATILVPEITVDAKGRVTSVTNRTYTSVNTDTNTDTKVTQTVTNDNAWYPLLIANTASASHTGLEPTTETDEVRKAYNINVQARYGFIYARNSHSADNLKGSVAGGNRTSAAFYGSTYDGATVGGVELGRVDKHGNRYSRLYATNYITDGALAPDGTAVATTFDVGVLADGTKYLNTGAGWYCNVYPTANNTRTLGTSSLRWKECYCNAYYLGTTAFGDIVTHNASEFLTSHQSLANYVTTNTDQSISGVKSHSKHISILGDYIGNESSPNGSSCLYLKAKRDTNGKSGIYVTKFRQNRAQGSMGNSDSVWLSHDILENETRTNAGFVELYSNWTNDVPGDISVYSTIATRNLGTSANPWTNAYITNLILNGNAFDPTSIDGIGTTRLLAYEPASASDYGSTLAGTTKSGSSLYDVIMHLDNATGYYGDFNSGSGEFIVTINARSTQSGTWKVLHNISASAPHSGTRSFIISMWVRIA